MFAYRLFWPWFSVFQVTPPNQSRPRSRRDQVNDDHLPLFRRHASGVFARSYLDNHHVYDDARDLRVRPYVCVDHRDGDGGDPALSR